MATLTVRSLIPRDIPRLFHVWKQSEVLAPIERRVRGIPGLTGSVRTLLPRTDASRRVYVAFVDDELCAYVVVEPESRRYCWDVLAVAAGSPRLETNDDVSVELWSALLEFAVRQAGEAHVKRLFAAASDGSAARQSLANAGFEVFTSHTVLAGDLPLQPLARPTGMRPQESSDVWSIHQLYHRITPRGVQFAEALTSATWEEGGSTRLPKVSIARRSPTAFVLEARDGIVGYCRVERRADGAFARVLMHPDAGEAMVDFVLATAVESGVGRAEQLCLAVPAYATQWIGQFVGAGFEVACEQLAMVRHTTVPAVVRSGLSPLPAMEATERVPRGVPTLMASRRPRRTTGDRRPALATHRSIERLGEGIANVH